MNLHLWLLTLEFDDRWTLAQGPDILPYLRCSMNFDDILKNQELILGGCNA
jgi:hypothetical protein